MTATWDAKNAALFIAGRSNETPETIERFLEADYRYAEQAGELLIPESDNPGEEITEVYQEASEISTPALIARRDYIAQQTRLPPYTVAHLLAYRVGYEASIDLIDADSYEFARDWAGSSPWPDLWAAYEPDWKPKRLEARAEQQRSEIGALGSPAILEGSPKNGKSMLAAILSNDSRLTVRLESKSDTKARRRSNRRRKERQSKMTDDQKEREAAIRDAETIKQRAEALHDAGVVDLLEDSELPDIRDDDGAPIFVSGKI